MIDFNDCKTYLFFTEEEKKLLIKLIIIFSILFTAFSSNLTSLNWSQLLIPVTIFTIFLFPAHIIFYKFCSYAQGFEMQFHELKFNRFHLESYETLTNRVWAQKPIPYTIISIIIALFSIGFIIYSSLLTYSHKKIDYLFFGKRKEFEYTQGNLYPQENTQLRQAYAHFNANLFLVGIIIILTFFKESTIFHALLLITISYSFFHLLPIIPSIGFQYFIQHTYLWGASFALFATFSIYALFFPFSSFIIFSITTVLIILIILFVQFINAIS